MSPLSPRLFGVNLSNAENKDLIEAEGLFSNLLNSQRLVANR
jgi:hypothetical protein